MRKKPEDPRLRRRAAADDGRGKGTGPGCTRCAVCGTSPAPGAAGGLAAQVAAAVRHCPVVQGAAVAVMVTGSAWTAAGLPPVWLLAAVVPEVVAVYAAAALLSRRTAEKTRRGGEPGT